MCFYGEGLMPADEAADRLMKLAEGFRAAKLDTAATFLYRIRDVVQFQQHRIETLTAKQPQLLDCDFDRSG